MSEVGFKAIFSMLNTVSIKYILKNAGIEYRPVREPSDVVMFNPGHQFNGEEAFGSISDSGSENGENPRSGNKVLSSEGVAEEESAWVEFSHPGDSIDQD